jgi:mannosylglycoprotein endo-beta-mannosidase
MQHDARANIEMATGTFGEAIDEQELRRAVTQGAGRKSQGQDGITAEFYRWGWTIIKEELLAVINTMFQEESITKNHAKVVICVPKATVPRRIIDYRPITLINADYKIYSQILANRMQTQMTSRS